MYLLMRWICMLGVALAAEASIMNHSETKPLVIVLMGPPGAGKGTHAGPLSAHMGLPHISTGDLFRENIRNQTELGKKAKEFIDQGKLVPDALVLDMLFDRVSREDCKQGYILDGFPRTLDQAKALDQKLQNKPTVINFQLCDEDVIARISGRIACKDCGRPHHKQFDPPKKEGVCDGCGGALYQRDDDFAAVVKKRLEVYRAQTMPLIEYYARQKGVLKEINSQQAKDVVFHNVLDSLPMQTAAK